MYDLVSSEMLTGPKAAVIWSKAAGQRDHLRRDMVTSMASKRNCGIQGVRVGWLTIVRVMFQGYVRAWIQQHGGSDGALCRLAWAPAENVQQDSRKRTSKGVGCSVSK